MRKGIGVVPLFLVVAILVLLAATVLPCTIRSKIAANEASATATLRSQDTQKTPLPATSERNGYRFVYTPGANGAYTITAEPVARGSSGQRSFMVDQSGVVRSNATAPASASDSPI